jgi:hypothetical protein
VLGNWLSGFLPSGCFWLLVLRFAVCCLLAGCFFAGWLVLLVAGWWFCWLSWLAG